MIFQEDDLGEFSVLVKPFTLSLIEEDTFASNKQPGCGKEIECIVTPATEITPNKEPSA